MKNLLKKISLYAVLAIIFTVSCTQKKSGSGEENSISIIPEPVSLKLLNSSFVLSEKTNIVVDSKDEKLFSTGKFLSEMLSDQYGIDILVSDGNISRDNAIVISESESFGEEAYELTVSKKGVIINGSSAGIFYGVQSLLQLIPAEAAGEKEIEIQSCEITDYPRFSWRGMHLDESRHFFGPEMARKYIDIMAMYKLNVFHWHLTDDQGWRIEIDKYPLLTEIGAWREGTGKEPWNYFVKPVTEGKPKYGGFYTKEEIREIIEYAAERHITIVPEIELPGHSWAALLAYPELSCSGVPWTKPDDVSFEFSDPFCAGNEKTFEFFENVLEEIIELFPSEYIHIGGDECKKTPWEDCDKCQQRMKTEGLENVEELQSYFIKRIEKIVLSKGRRIIGWNEILEGGLAPEATVMSWQGEKGGIEAAKHGHAVVMTPGTNLYFNKEQFIPEKKNNPKVLLIEDVYNYHPVPDVLNEQESKLILGAQGCLWSEFLYSEKILEIQLLPRLTAMAEMVWTNEDNKDWESYQHRLGKHLPKFDMMGVNYYVPSPSGLEDRIFIEEEYLVEIDEIGNIAYQSSNIHYTTDGTEPCKDSKIYNEPFYVSDGSIVKAKIFMLSGGESATSESNYKKVNLQNSTEEADLQAGMNLQLFTGDISTLDNFSNMKFSKQIVVSEIQIPQDVPDDHFGLIFTGFIDIPSDGVYTFYSTSDDGSRLFLNGNLLVCNDGIHGMELKYGQAALAGGKHALKLLYFENNYGEGLNVEIEGPGLERQEVPAEYLFNNTNN